MASDWLDLPTPPALPGLYLRAALRRAVTGRTLPNRGLRCQVEVNPEHLARYRQICGFRDDGRLPATYPHVLAFALQLKLLTEQGFPFPLLGLVHLENRIRVMRPLRGLGPFVVSVEVNNLAAHEKGAVFSLITRLQDPLGPLWEGDSRILCRDLTLEGPVIERSEEAALQLFEVDSWLAPANIGRAYARVAGDYNPIHLSATSARLFGFPHAIAHGLWNKARSLAALSQHLPAAGYAMDVRFQKPVLLPATLR
ncbi:MAG: acyl dehydratase, partial [Pseudomonadales bacterium RIFCSPLOWO2_02_FULL_63_210]